MSKPCTMMLAKNADAKYIQSGHTFGLYEKVDGIPGVDSHLEHPDMCVLLSRQKELIRSARHVSLALKQARTRIQDNPDISDYMKRLVHQPCVGELHVPGKCFKDAAGIIRRHKEDERIRYALFDIQDTAPFGDRRMALALLNRASNGFVHTARHFVDMYVPPSGRGAMVIDECEALLDENPGMEGVMIRDLNGSYRVGARSWGMQRVTRTPTIDLRVLGFEEAESAAGIKLGMVGKVIVSYNGREEGVGPGKLTHEERRALWEMFLATKAHGASPWQQPLAEIKYKQDDTYKGLRQGTFQCWRPDKDVPDA